MKEGNTVRRWRTATVLALGAVIGVMLMAAPAGAHFLPSISHIWHHIKPIADARYANAVPGTDKAKNATKVDGQEVRAFAHTTTVGNISTNCTYLDNPVVNNNPTAHVMAIHQYTASYLDKNLGAYYDSVLGKWCIFLADQSAMPTGQTFQIIAVDPPGAPVTRPVPKVTNSGAPGH
jgi:hypothetical protein